MRRHSDPDDLTLPVILLTVGIVVIVVLMHMRSWYYDQVLESQDPPAGGISIEHTDDEVVAIPDEPVPWR